MNDFETVREYVRAAAGFDQSKGEAALDRIEAEVERLRAKYDECWADWNAAKNEAKRLKKKSDWLVGALRAEEAVSGELQAEIERLRAQVKHTTTDYDDARSRVFDAEAGLTKWHDAWLKAEAEAERLRAENELHRIHKDQMDATVLRFHAAIEQMRLTVPAGQATPFEQRILAIADEVLGTSEQGRPT